MSVGTDDGCWREHWKNHQSGAVLFLTFRHGVSKNDLALSQRNLILAFSSTYMVGLGGGGLCYFFDGKSKEYGQKRRRRKAVAVRGGRDFGLR